jgi:hypothetical protein
MGKRLGGVLGLWLVVCPLARAEEKPRGSLVLDTWDAAYLEGAKAGYVHTSVRRIERDGQPLLATSTELRLTIRRGNESAQVSMDTGTEETPDGKVVRVTMTQYFGNKPLVVDGTVEGRQLHVTSTNGLDKRIRWDERVLGLYGQELMFQKRPAKPGDQFTYLSYEPTITTVVPFRVTVGEEEEVEVLGVKKHLLRAEAVPDKLPGIPLPTLTVWLSEDRLPVRSRTELPGLGRLDLYRATRGAATAPNDTQARRPDLLLNTLIPLDRALRRPHETASVVYRITVEGEDDPASAFAQDERQRVLSKEGRTLTLLVRANREPGPNGQPARPKDEFTKSCYFINSDDPTVKRLARQAVGDAADSWGKARRIEKWVHEHMTHSNAVSFGTAGQVARDLKGDCRQHAMLTAAMCRAAGVPSRTAVGLVYVNDRQRGPAMGFHMWTEVWVRGQWLALDATLGRGSIGAGHLKIADHSWYDTQSLTPVLPVLRVLGKVHIQIERVNGA